MLNNHLSLLFEILLDHEHVYERLLMVKSGSPEFASGRDQRSFCAFLSVPTLETAYLSSAMGI